MEELIQRISAAAGIDPALAEKSIGIILSFLNKEAPSSGLTQMIESIPGASEAVAAAGQESGGGGLLGSVMGMMGGGGGLMGLAGQLTSAGLGMGEMQTVGKELFAVVREKAGEDVVGEIAGAVPGLGQFI